MCKVDTHSSSQVITLLPPVSRARRDREIETDGAAGQENATSYELLLLVLVVESLVAGACLFAISGAESGIASAALSSANQRGEIESERPW